MNALRMGLPVALGATLAVLCAPHRHVAPDRTVPSTAVTAAAAERPLAFERNDGQTDPRVRFVARGAGGAVFVTDDGLTIAPRGRGRPPLRFTFDGAVAPSVEGEERLPGVANYILGRDRSKWLANVPTFARAVCRGVWPGVDVVFHGGAQRVEYDFEIAPGADPSAVALRFEGADAVRVDAAGDLVVRADGEESRHLRPRVLQDGRELAGAFVERGGGRVGFRVEGRDAARPLVIDPVIAYATYLGGSDGESTSDITVDAKGEVYVTGSVTSIDFPLAHSLPGAPGAGGTDAFVTKLNASGAKILYSTYFGGAGLDAGFGIRADATGIWLAGSTTSPDFPAVGGFQQAVAGGTVDGDAFLVKLEPGGSSVIFSTMLGGTGDDACRGLEIDAAGDAYLAGVTTSTDFPTTGSAIQKQRKGASDGWIARIGATGAQLRWSTYFGGSAPDTINGIARDANGRVFVAGFTSSFDLPASAGFQVLNNGGTYDGFVAKFDVTGELMVCTYLGGSDNDGCRRIRLDSSGRAYVAGFTLSGDFPVKDPLQASLHGSDGAGDGFVAELDAALATRVFATYLGGAANEDVSDLAIAADGSVFVAGQTTSFTFPLVDPVQVGIGGLRDGFIAKLAPAGAQIVWSTFYGGAGYDTVGGLCLDSSGDAYVAMSAGAGDLPALCAAQPAYRGGFTDCYVVKLTDTPSDKPGRPLVAVATATSAYHVDFVWVDGSRNECSFRVERREGDGEFVVLATPDTNVTSWSDPTVLPDRTYAYRVIAVNPLGESDPSDESSVTTDQTITIGQRKGALTESNANRRDRIQFTALLRFGGGSLDHTLIPPTEGVEIEIGANADPLVLRIPAGDRRWKKHGSKTYTWSSPKKAKPQVRLSLDLAARSMSLTLSQLDFPTTPNGAIFLALRGGDDGGHTLRTWTPRKKKPGRFKLP